LFKLSYLNFYDCHFDKEILGIEYIDTNRNKKSIYCIYFDFIYLLQCILNFNNKFNKKSINEISTLILNKKEGLLVINYFNKEHKKIIVNLKIFNENNIYNIIDSFISYEIKNEIMYIELDNIDITNKFLLFKNSYKLDNLKLSDIIYAINVIYSKYYNESCSIKITDNELNENIYEHNKYINL
tara:strand:+ start:1091 stop:1642 length:552 start_codon:yes stop_codon:yes gene_type:complete